VLDPKCFYDEFIFLTAGSEAASNNSEFGLVWCIWANRQLFKIFVGESQ